MTKEIQMTEKSSPEVVSITSLSLSVILNYSVDKRLSVMFITFCSFRMKSTLVLPSPDQSY